MIVVSVPVSVKIRASKPQSNPRSLQVMIVSIGPPHDGQPHRCGMGTSGYEDAAVSVEANRFMPEAAPLATAFPTSIASAISSGATPISRVLSTWYCRQVWQFAATDAPTAISSLVRMSNPMACTSVSVLPLLTEAGGERIQKGVRAGISPCSFPVACQLVALVVIKRAVTLQIPPESGPGAVQADFDRLERDVEHPGDFRVRKPRQVAHREHRPVRFGKSLDAAPDAGVHLLPDDLALDGKSALLPSAPLPAPEAVSVFRGRTFGRLLRGFLPERRGTQPVEGGVRRDPVDPGGDAGLAPETGKPAPDLDEDLLGQVLRLVPADDAGQVTDDSRTITNIERVEIYLFFLPRVGRILTDAFGHAPFALSPCGRLHAVHLDARYRSIKFLDRPGRYGQVLDPSLHDRVDEERGDGKERLLHNSDLQEPCGRNRFEVLVLRHRPGDAADVGRHGLLHRFRKRLRQDQIGNHQPAARLEHTERLIEYPSFLRGEVDDAIGDDDVHRPVGDGEVLDLAKAEFHVLVPTPTGVLPRLLEHLGSHVHADHPSFRADFPRCKKAVEPRPRPEIEDRLSLFQGSERRRVAAPEPQVGPLGHGSHFRFRISYPPADRFGRTFYSAG